MVASPVVLCLGKQEHAATDAYHRNNGQDNVVSRHVLVASVLARDSKLCHGRTDASSLTKTDIQIAAALNVSNLLDPGCLLS